MLLTGVPPSHKRDARERARPESQDNASPSSGVSLISLSQPLLHQAPKCLCRCDSFLSLPLHIDTIINTTTRPYQHG